MRGDRKMTRDEALKKMFESCLEAQNLYGVQVFFDWAPHVNQVEAFTYNDGRWNTESSGNELDYIFQKYLDDGDDFEWIAADACHRVHAYFARMKEGKATV